MIVGIILGALALHLWGWKEVWILVFIVFATDVIQEMYWLNTGKDLSCSLGLCGATPTKP